VSTWAVIPVKPSKGAKTRLSGVLSAAEREGLVEAMLAHVVTQTRSAGLVDHVCILGPSRLGISPEVPLLPDPGKGLNPALQAALERIAGQAATRMIVIHADLPKLANQDVQLLAAAPPGTIAIAPDRHGTGTNALSLPLPEARGFTFAFGPDSFALHHTEAERLGLPVEEIHSQGLARDIDEPPDLADARELIGGAE
jgi:2-phospho-L-lactate/phosphoenolpyruvate guanylyltransferase